MANTLEQLRARNWERFYNLHLMNKHCTSAQEVFNAFHHTGQPTRSPMELEEELRARNWERLNVLNNGREVDGSLRLCRAITHAAYS
ncbi:MAG: hypothetical protein K2X00_19185 [Nitrospiraceae bacterium]|nr:hypothetical protein [Nitrospiraceae bacterium]